MIKYLKEKHGITEINNKKISSYTSLSNKKYLKNYIEKNYGITDIYINFIQNITLHILPKKKK